MIYNYELQPYTNYAVCRIDDPIEKLGYEIVGPIVLSFCQWVHEKFIQEHFERHGRFTIIVEQREIAFISINKRMLYKLYP